MQKGISRLIVLVVCALATSCASSGTSQGPQVPPTHPAGEASPSTPTVFGNPAVAFTDLHDGSTVSFQQDVTGTITGLPPGMDAWLIVKPSGADAYWPQRPGPLSINGNQFSGAAQFGVNSSSSKGELFTLQIAETTKGVSSDFMGIISNPEESSLGTQQLPASSVLRTLRQVTVTRK